MKDGMSDIEMYRILNDFANEHALAAGVEINVYEHGTTITALDKENGTPYENIVLLSDIIRGATHLLMWARRANRVRFRSLKRGKGIKK